MRFFTEKSSLKVETIFGVIVTDIEYQAKIEQKILFSILNRIALMMAGYYFKRHKDELIEFIKSDELKLLVAQQLAARITMEADK